jgi:hypothetical protein
LSVGMNGAGKIVDDLHGHAVLPGGVCTFFDPPALIPVLPLHALQRALPRGRRVLTPWVQAKKSGLTSWESEKEMLRTISMIPQSAWPMSWSLQVHCISCRARVGCEIRSLARLLARTRTNASYPRCHIDHSACAASWGSWGRLVGVLRQPPCAHAPASSSPASHGPSASSSASA